MGGKSPSTEEWRELYDAAIKFKEVGCWDWMRDSDIFGVQDPVSSEIGYCCVMGMLGEHFALALYQGREGLEGYLRMRSGDIPSSPGGALSIQKCLMASFEDRELLEKRDLQVIKSLGLKFRGRNSWPLFRSYRPGYYPWYLTSEEAKFLTEALLQTIDVSLRLKKDPELLHPPEEGQYLVRVLAEEDGDLKWSDQWLEPPPLEKKKVEVGPIDPERLERIGERRHRRRGAWEVGLYHFPEPVKENERPYFPLVLLTVDRDTGLILGFHLAKPTERASSLVDQFLDFLEDTRLPLPERILVVREKTLKLLEPIARRLKIELENVERLPELEAAQYGLLSSEMREKYEEIE